MANSFTFNYQLTWQNQIILICSNVYLFIFTETTTDSPYMYLMLDIPPSPLYKVLNCFYHNPHCYGFLFFNKDTLKKK